MHIPMVQMLLLFICININKNLNVTLCVIFYHYQSFISKKKTAADSVSWSPISSRRPLTKFSLSVVQRQLNWRKRFWSSGSLSTSMFDNSNSPIGWKLFGKNVFRSHSNALKKIIFEIALMSDIYSLIFVIIAI